MQLLLVAVGECADKIFGSALAAVVLRRTSSANFSVQRVIIIIGC